MPNPSRDDFRFDRLQLADSDSACEFVERGPIAKAIQSPDNFAQFTFSFQGVKLLQPETLNLIEALRTTLAENDLMENYEGALVADIDSYFYLIKFGVLLLSGEFGEKPDTSDPESDHDVAEIKYSFIDVALRIASEYRRMNLSDHALKVLDLLNLIDHGADQWAEAARRIKL